VPACPCWRQPAHSDYGEDAGVLLNSVIYTVSVHRGVDHMCFSRSGPTHFLRWIVYYCVCIQHHIDKSQISFTELRKTFRTNSGLRAINSCLHLFWLQLCNRNICAVSYVYLPSVLWRCWLGGRKRIRRVNNWVVGCWHGYLSGARCTLAYGLDDATATHCLFLQ